MSNHFPKHFSLHTADTGANFANVLLLLRQRKQLTLAWTN